MSMVVFKKPRRRVNRVFIHCSASDHAHHDDVKHIRKMHTDAKSKGGRGWSDVGYHYFIRKDGLVQAGRPLEKIPAAQANHNTGSIAICLHGLDEDKFTDAQFTSLQDLCGQIDVAYAGKVTFHGHREVSPKSCPVFNYQLVLGLASDGRLVGRGRSDKIAGTPPKRPTHKPLTKSRTMWSGGITGGVLTGMGTWFTTLTETNPEMAYIMLGLAVVGVIATVIIMWERIKKFRRGE